jgi:hypothetical protein
MAQANESTSTTSVPGTRPAAPSQQIRMWPFVIQVGSGFVPFIHHPERPTPWLRVERFPRKAKATAGEALQYAQRVVWYRQMRAAEKRRRLEATVHPRYIAYLRSYLEAAE